LPDLWSIALLLFLLCASAGVGYLVKARLPERHRSRDSIELTQLGITLLATFAAIVLGLLTTSVKAGYNAAYSARGTYAAQFAQLDQCLREYGPETAPIREQLQSYVAAVIASTWPDEKPPTGVRYPDTSKLPLTGESSLLGAIINAVGKEVLELQPADPLRQRILTQCAQQYSDLVKSRWTVIEEARGSISAPFYWVLVFWLVILFACLGLSAPADAMAVIVIALSAISITGTVFVIVDLDLPYGGLFGISSESMRNALADMMR
jgi:hypothetical protein